MNISTPLAFDLYYFIVKIINDIAGIDNIDNIDKVVLEPTKDPSHGDLATNAAMVYAKITNQSPKILAAKICEKLAAHAGISKTEIAGPGFINITLTAKVLQDEVPKILEYKGKYGNLDVGENKSVNVEYVSTNPTGPLHIGHGRNAVLGDTISSLLEKAGYRVTREYYVNDAGGQTIALARSAYVRYKEAFGESISDSDFDEDMYKGDYLVPVGAKLKEEFGDRFLNKSSAEYFEEIRKFTISEMMKYIVQDLKLLGINMDVYSSESEIISDGNIEQALDKLTKSADVYEGVLEKPKGHQVDDWEERPQVLFKSTNYGDDIDRALKKSDGSWTYFAGDVGYHFHKIKRNFEKIINVLGFDHVGYIKRLRAAVKALEGTQEYTVKTCQMVNFSDSGKPIRMSKRAGNFITVKDLIEKVGKDATRFMMVSRHQDMTIDFDFQKVVEQSKDNPLFYIQYAHARIYSVLRHAIEVFGKIVHHNSLKSLDDPAELNLIKVLIQWPRVVLSAAQHLEPHRIANYLYDVASSFHSLWNKGKENNMLRFIDIDKEETTSERIALIRATANIIAEGLHLLGIEPLEEMR